MYSSKPSTWRAMNASVEGAPPLQLGRQRPRQHHVGAGQERQVQIGLLGDLGAQGIDHHEPAAVAPRLADAAHEVQVRR